ncbi:TAXI family TRAP transporter solute-binding subunit [Marinivivus vitaminiproducens]|uniref:TAXI family TRAP transporter solute-binding subunit n=1 Tax=Marinivivus vitaminiproducens TaxID=3035935 RepID=UPI00279D5256|nr:TAXI family TRAP transporter solute-binding subunit [Geminicoccaceae bacterium SCSIO 64248]
MSSSPDTRKSTSWARERLGIFSLSGLAVIAAFVVAYQFVEPAPPDRIVMATGAEDGAYNAYGRHYKALLEQQGVTVELRQTTGAVENYGLLRREEGGADVAFMQGGVAPEHLDPGLKSLASVFLEPLWLFSRDDPAPTLINDLAGRRVAVGTEGSGTRSLALRLLEASDLADGRNIELVPLGGGQAADALERGEVDAAFFVSAASAGVVQRLVGSDGIRLVDLAQAEGYAQVFRFLEPVKVHEGALDFARNRPPRTIDLLASTATLVARADLHPALVDLLLLAAQEVHAQGDLFTPPETFPSQVGASLPLDESAERFFQRGPPFLQRYLPFWAATLIDRMSVMLIPLLTLMLPLIRLLPPVVAWRMRSRVNRWYAQLIELESAVDHPERRAEARTQLKQLDQEVRHINVPLSYTASVYQLRAHIDLIDRRLRAAETDTVQPVAPPAAQA